MNVDGWGRERELRRGVRGNTPRVPERPVSSDVAQGTFRLSCEAKHLRSFKVPRARRPRT